MTCKDSSTIARALLGLIMRAAFTVGMAKQLLSASYGVATTIGYIHGKFKKVQPAGKKLQIYLEH